MILHESIINSQQRHGLLKLNRSISFGGERKRVFEGLVGQLVLAYIAGKRLLGYYFVSNSM